MEIAVTIIAVMTLFYTYVQVTTKKVLVSYTNNGTLFYFTKPYEKNDFKIFYKNEDIENANTLNVLIKNIGNKHINEEDYKKPKILFSIATLGYYIPLVFVLFCLFNADISGT